MAAELGVEIVEDTRVAGLDGERDGPVTCGPPAEPSRAERVALGTNVFPSLLGATGC